MATIAATPGRTTIPNPDEPITRAEAEDLHAHMRTIQAETKLENKDLVETVGNISIAVFGNPMDTADHGIVGDIREVGHKLDRIFHSVLGICGVLVIVAVTIALAVH